MEDKRFYSTNEVAQVLGISRIAVFKRIISGKLKAIKIGRIYAVPRSEFQCLSGDNLTLAQKKVIEDGVIKTIKEYKETLRLLGKE